MNPTTYNLRHIKDLLLYKVRADLRVDARGYYLGYVWWILEPIFEMAVFYVVFSYVLGRGGEHYIQFLLIGLLAWKWFSTTITRCMASITQGKGLMQQVVIPKLFFPLVEIGTNTFKAAVSGILLMVFLAATGFHVAPVHGLLPVILLGQLVFISAVGFVLAAITPYIPDFRFLVTLSMRGIFFLSAIFYSPERFPENARPFFMLNPMAVFIDAYREIILHQRWPHYLGHIAVWTLISMLMIILVVRFVARRETKYPRIVSI
jgi:lipopolysaccharide transport system permease protein